MTTKPVFLYVEDDLVSRSIMQMLLCRVLGYDQVTIFADSADFMSKVEALPTKPDVIFLDIHVHPHNGFQMLDMLRSHEQYKDTSVVALTASVMNEEVEQLHNAGFDGGIAKPLDQARFPDLLQQILRKEKIWQIR
jgi:two-component system, cell cycle response regulator DivK